MSEGESEIGVKPDGDSTLLSSPMRSSALIRMTAAGGLE
jgi:hypothetical protein